MNALDRPVAVVTGATRGIGLAIARDLAMTHHVVIGGRDRERVEGVVDELPSATAFVADLADLADQGSAAEALAELAARLPRVDVLVNSAGVLHRGTVADTTTADWLQSMTVNVVAVAAVTRALLPALRAAEGLVVMLNSGSGLEARATFGPYAAAKFALRALTDSLREEERSHHVRVTSLHPGRVDTDMQRELVAFDGDRYEVDRYLRVESVVRALRLAVDATPDASIDLISIRPTGRPTA